MTPNPSLFIEVLQLQLRNPVLLSIKVPVHLLIESKSPHFINENGFRSCCTSSQRESNSNFKYSCGKGITVLEFIVEQYSDSVEPHTSRIATQKFPNSPLNLLSQPEKYYREISANQGTLDYRVQEISTYLERHLFSEELRTRYLDQLSRLVHLSPSRVCALFKREKGCTISEYRSWAKLKALLELLGSQSYSMTEMAHQRFFHDSSHMNKQFIKHLGIPPQKLQQRLLAVNRFKINQ